MAVLIRFESDLSVNSRGKSGKEQLFIELDPNFL